MIEQGNAAKAKQRGGPGAGAGAPAPRSSSEKSDRPGRLSRAIRPPAHNQERVAAALVGARSRQRRPGLPGRCGDSPSSVRCPTLRAPSKRCSGDESDASRKKRLPRSICSCESPLYPESEESRRSPRGWCPLPANPHRCTFSCGDSLSFGGCCTRARPGKPCAGDDSYAARKSDPLGRFARAIRLPEQNQKKGRRGAVIGSPN